MIESKFNALSRFASDLSQRTQETDLLEHLQHLQTSIQRLKLHIKDLLSRTTESQARYSSYAQQRHTYEQAIDELQALLDKTLGDANEWTNNRQAVSAAAIQNTSHTLQLLLQDQPAIQRQANLLHELTESLLDSAENAEFFR